MLLGSFSERRLAVINTALEAAEAYTRDLAAEPRRSDKTPTFGRISLV